MCTVVSEPIKPILLRELTEVFSLLIKNNLKDERQQGLDTFLQNSFKELHLYPSCQVANLNFMATLRAIPPELEEKIERVLVLANIFCDYKVNRDDPHFTLHLDQLQDLVEGRRWEKLHELIAAGLSLDISWESSKGLHVLWKECVDDFHVHKELLVSIFRTKSSRLLDHLIQTRNERTILLLMDSEIHPETSWCSKVLWLEVLEWQWVYETQIGRKLIDYFTGKGDLPNPHPKRDLLIRLIYRCDKQATIRICLSKLAFPTLPNPDIYLGSVLDDPEFGQEVAKVYRLTKRDKRIIVGMLHQPKTHRRRFHQLREITRWVREEAPSTVDRETLRDHFMPLLQKEVVLASTLSNAISWLEDPSVKLELFLEELDLLDLNEMALFQGKTNVVMRFFEYEFQQTRNRILTLIREQVDKTIAFKLLSMDKMLQPFFPLTRAASMAHFIKDLLLPLLNPNSSFQEGAKLLHGALEQHCECFLASKRLDDERLTYPLLISAGFANFGSIAHYCLLSIEKEIDQPSFRITLYNSDMRENRYHHQLEGTQRFQTALAYEGVPLNDLVKNWDDIARLEAGIELCIGQEAMYDILFKVVKNGRAVKPSCHDEDYEAPQKGLSCSAQSYMAFIRDFTMRLYSGTAQEKLGYYKAFKAHMLIQLPSGTSNEPWLEKPFALKRNKIEADIEQWIRSQDESQYCDYVTQVTRIFSEVGIDHSSSPPKTQVARFISLRNLDRLCASTVQNPEDDERIAAIPSNLRLSILSRAQARCYKQDESNLSGSFP